jgi:hypothetical protein
MLVALGHEYSLPLGKPNALAIAERLPFGVGRLVTFRSLDRLSPAMVLLLSVRLIASYICTALLCYL